MLEAKDDGKGARTLTLTGDFDIYSAAVFKQELAAHLDGCDTLTIDLSAVNEMDTACFQVLMRVKLDFDAQGRELRLVSHSPVVLDILELYGLEGFFGDPLVLQAKTTDNHTSAR